MNNYIELKIFTENNELKEKYQKKSTDHNSNISKLQYPDSGFDLFIPKNHTINGNESKKIDLEIKCSMNKITYGEDEPLAYYLYPRSSMGSKTKFRLANSVGIIDSGYRGFLGAVLDNISNEPQNTETNRLLQICSPTLQPFLVSIVNNEKELGSTERGCGGFGSTGSK
jgi:dUTP pyrophosphatase